MRPEAHWRSRWRGPWRWSWGLLSREQRGHPGCQGASAMGAVPRMGGTTHADGGRRIDTRAQCQVIDAFDEPVLVGIAFAGHRRHAVTAEGGEHAGFPQGAVTVVDEAGGAAREQG